MGPEIDIFQKNDQLTIRADLPGMKREDVSVEISETAVTIQGERERESEDERDGYIAASGAMAASVASCRCPRAPSPTKPRRTSVMVVLEVTMPASPASKGRRLEIGDAAKNTKK